MTTRAPNRTLTDALLEAVLDAEALGLRWTYLEDVEAQLGWRSGAALSTATLLVHGYGALQLLPSTRAVRSVPAGIERYLDGDRTPCPCTRCPGEYERRH